MNRLYLQHQIDARRHSKKPLNVVNQQIIGVPSHLNGKRFEIVKYVRGAHTRQCPWRFEEIPYLQYIQESVGYHHFIAPHEKNILLICKIKDDEKKNIKR